MNWFKNTIISLILWPKNHWKLTLFIVVLAALGGGFYYRRVQQSKPVLVFENPKRESITKTLDISGFVDAKEKARLRFLAGGKITYLGVQTGNQVKKGQTLATVDPATLKKQLQQDLNVFMKERLDWDQQNVDIFQNEYTTREERERQKGQLDLTNQVLNVEIRDIAINNTRLSAPFAGIVTVSPTTTAGVQLTASDYFEVINPNTLIFKAEVDESDIALVKLNQKAQLKLDAYSETEITSYVNYIAYTSSQGSNGTIFVIELPLDSTRYGMDYFRLGMNGDVSIELASKQNVITIPILAVKERDGKKFVDVKTSESTTSEKEITTGLETDDKVEVTAGLSEQDLILIPE